MGNVDAWKAAGVSSTTDTGAVHDTEGDDKLVLEFQRRENQQKQQQAHLIAAKQDLAIEWGVSVDPSVRADMRDVEIL